MRAKVAADRWQDNQIRLRNGLELATTTCYGARVPVSAVLVLRPLRPAVVPAAPGISVYAAALRVLGLSDPERARDVHDGDGPAPLAISALAGPGDRRSGRLALEPGGRWWVRISSLHDDLVLPIAEALSRDSYVLTVDSADLAVDAVHLDESGHPAAGRLELSALTNGHAEAIHGGELVMHFDSPTFFRSDPHDALFPEPRLVLGSAARRLQAAAPDHFRWDDDLAQQITQHVRVTRYELATKVLQVRGTPVAGFVGDVVYRIDRDAPSAISGLVEALAATTRFAGCGAKIAWGFGQCRRLQGGLRQRRR